MANTHNGNNFPSTTIPGPEGGGGETPQDEPSEQTPGPEVFLVRATYIPQHKSLLVDLSQIGDVSFLRAPSVRGETKGKKQQTPQILPPAPPPPKRVASSALEAIAGLYAATENGGMSLVPGAQVTIHPPGAHLHVRSDQTLMLKVSKDGSADILETNNWGYSETFTPESALSIKAKNTANFLNYQRLLDGYRFAWCVNHAKQDVILLGKKGRFSARNLLASLREGYSEFFYSEVAASRHFRLPSGIILESKRMVDLSATGEEEEEPSRLSSMPPPPVPTTPAPPITQGLVGIAKPHQ